MSAPALRDDDLRWPLHRWLREAYQHCAGDTEILHEVKIPRPSARIDLAVINGELCGFEIKSDVDTLSRLPQQMRAFNAVFERVSIVTTSRHLTAARNSLPEWWGILMPTIVRGKHAFDSVRGNELNPAVNPEAMLHMLHRAEMFSILVSHGLGQGKRAWDRHGLIDALIANLSPNEIRQGVRSTLKKRASSQAVPTGNLIQLASSRESGDAHCR